MANTTVVNGEIWMQPHPRLTLAELRKLIEERTIVATPRLGARDANHSKGYVIGQEAWLILKNEEGREELRRRIKITGLGIRQLMDFSPLSLAGCGDAHQNWQSIRQTLEFFERRVIHPQETATIVRFKYLDNETA